MLNVSFCYFSMNTQQFSFPLPFGAEGIFETFCLRNEEGKPLDLSIVTQNVDKMISLGSNNECIQSTMYYKSFL